MSDSDSELKNYVATLPQRPGVYRMYAADGELLYVGKAARLRDRVGSYFGRQDLAPKVAAMVRRIARIEVTVVNSEPEALLLECNLIKAHRPRYNIMLRDDKSFPYILCPLGHEFPRLVFYRGPQDPNSRLFGPFASAHAVKEVLQHLQKVFKIRNCRDSFFANRSRPCLQYQIGRCSAPCVALISREDYARDLQGAIGVLEGRNAEVIGELQQRMEAAAGQLQFEDAARLRDQLRELQEIRAQQIANAQRRADIDVIAIAGEPGQYAICVLPVREGQNLGTASHFPASALSEPADTLADFLLLYYSREPAPPEILINIALPDHEPLAQALERAAGRASELRVPQRGLKRQWLELALENARNALRMRLLRAELALEGLQVLARVLHLPRPPERVECFDVSHTAGEGTVASCVVFTPEGARKSDYRRYNIEGVTPGDDYACHAPGTAAPCQPDRQRRAAATRSAADRRRCRPGRGGGERARRSRLRGPGGGRHRQGCRPAARPGAAVQARRADPDGAASRQRRTALCAARARRGAPLRDQRTSAAARAPLPRVDPRDHPGPGSGAPPRAVDAFRWPAGGDARRRRGPGKSRRRRRGDGAFAL